MPPLVPQFKLGDFVLWCWNTRGNTYQIRGRVVEVVPPMVVPTKRWETKQALRIRAHESYVVQCCGKRYWPRVELLARARIPVESHEQV